MSQRNSPPYEIEVMRPARRAISHRLPEAIAIAVVKFLDGPLADTPHRVGKPLFGPLAGCHGARRGTYRIIHRIDDKAHVVKVLDIDHRADVYHR